MFKKICILLTTFCLFQSVSTTQAETISKGVTYTTKSETLSGTPQLFRHITVQPDTGNYWMTTKGRDRVLATESLPSQVSRVTASGGRVVTAINADMYRVASGLPIGLQIQQNQVLVSHSVKDSATKFPSFMINGQGKPEIGSFGIIGSATTDTKRVTIHSVNRNENLANRIGIFSSAHHASKMLKLIEPSEAMKKEIAIVYLKGTATSAFTLGKNYQWTVESVDTTFRKEIRLPDAGVVLVGLGKQKAALLALVKAAEEKSNGLLSTQLNLVQLSNLQMRNDIQEAVSGYNWLIQNGVGYSLDSLALNHDRFLMLARKARTLIGTTSNGTVQIITVDQARLDSKGITMLEAVEQIKRLGVTSALAFDGGGSTEIMVRRAGEFLPKTANVPADGRSRSITNGLILATHYVPSNVATTILLTAPKELYVGEKGGFGLKLTDANGQPVDATKKSIIWKGTGVKGLQVTAPLTPGKWTGTMQVDRAKRTVSIPVTNRLTGLTVNGGRPILLKVGQRLAISSEGWLNGRRVVIPASQLNYQVANGATASITKGNILAKKIGKTELTVSSGGKTVRLPVTVSAMKKEEVIDSFEQGVYEAKSPYVSSYAVRLSSLQKSSGKQSLEMTYDYSGWKKQNGAMYIKKASWIIPSPARALTMDVYGDGRAPWLRSEVKDAAGNRHVVDFVKKVDWKGFKTVQATLDPTWPTPLKIESLYFVETDTSKKGTTIKSKVYLDQLKVLY